MDYALKSKLQKIADDAGTTIDIVAQVLIVTSMHGRRAADDAMLRDAAARVMELEALVCRCRQVMEANDPGNARDIFGEPAPAAPEGAATVP